MSGTEKRVPKAGDAVEVRPDGGVAWIPVTVTAVHSYWFEFKSTRLVPELGRPWTGVRGLSHEGDGWRWPTTPSSDVTGEPAQQREHALKTHPGPFAAIRNGNKAFEFRKNDRDFRSGDVLVLNEWIPPSPEDVTGSYTGQQERRVVTYIVHGPAFGIPEGYCVMSVRPESATLIDHQRPISVVPPGEPAKPLWNRLRDIRETVNDAYFLMPPGGARARLNVALGKMERILSELWERGCPSLSLLAPVPPGEPDEATVERVASALQQTIGASMAFGSTGAIRSLESIVEDCRRGARAAIAALRAGGTGR